MAHTRPGFAGSHGDELSLRTLPVFFGALELLLRAGVTTVAEAAFQDGLWRRGLVPLGGLAQLRVVRCQVAARVAFQRSLRRRAGNHLRQVHADPGPADAAAQAAAHGAFRWLTLDAPVIEVDTTDGYRPALAQIAAFAGGQGVAGG
jgi:predicted kinase